MIHNMNEQVKEYMRRHRLSGRWGKVLTVLACLVVFCTTYALILPAVTLDHETACGQEEHTHTADACYAKMLVCTDESTGHVHSDTCYADVLTCALSEHQHTESCYAQEKNKNGSADVSEIVSGTQTDADTELTGAGDAKLTGATGSEPIGTSGEDGVEKASEALVLKEQTVSAVIYTDAAYSTPSDDSVTITLEGTLPEGVQVKAYPASVDLNDDSVKVIEAYDIGLFVTVTDETTGETVEKEYEPERAVRVKITSDELSEIETVDAYHIGDAPGSVPERVSSKAAVNENTVEFDADEFSVYVLATTAQEEESESENEKEKENEKEIESDPAAAIDNDGIDMAAVTDNGNNSFSMAVGDTLTVNEYSGFNHTYVSSYTSGGGWGGGRTYTSSSSNTSVATLSVNNGTATVTAKGAGTAIVTLYYSTSGGWGASSYNSETLTITVAGDEQAALYFLKNPMADPMSNETGGWVPDSTKNQSQIIGTVNTAGAAWVDNKNITSNPGNYITAWPDGSTNGNAWTINTDNEYFSRILNLVFAEWKSELESELGISDLQKSDVTSITITPCKISKDNGTSPDKHIDCRIVLVSDKFFKTQFWVKEPGASDYDLQAYKFFKKGSTIPEPNSNNYSGTGGYTYNYKIGDTREVSGVTYVLTGWYAENDAGGAHSDTTANFAYTPNNAELNDGIVNFYAEWVPATNDLTIVKYEKSDTSKLLSGAVFTMTDTGDKAKTYTFEATNRNGETTLSNIPYGTYTLSETTAPTNYQTISSFAVTVGKTIAIDEGNTGAELKDDGKLWIPDEKSVVDLTIKKVDSANSNETLSGAVFKLSGKSEQSFEEKTVTTGNDGTVTIKNLPVGQYTLIETTAPDGYDLLTEEITLTVSSDSVTASYGNDGSNSVVRAEGTTVTIKNSAGETLPNTGGMGTRMYTLSGLMLVAIATLGGMMYSGRKRRRGGVR